MNAKNSLLILFSSTLLFGLLFHNKSLGINLVIYEGIMLGWLLFTSQLGFRSFLEKMLIIAQISTLTFTVLHHSAWSFFIHFFVSFLLVGAMIAPLLQSLLGILAMSMSNVFLCFHELFVKEETTVSRSQSRRNYQFKRLRLYLIPMAIIAVFASIYGLANPNFGTYVDLVFTKISDGFRLLFESIDFWLFTTLLFGFLVSIFVLRRGKNTTIEAIDARKEDHLKRQKRAFGDFKNMALKNEARAGIFLFTSLNILLFFMNIMDVDHVWLHFEWEGQFLKQFVHQGTILLLIAIVLSVILVLSFFRGNLNFYSKNKWLKNLCYLWLGQNVILAISAGIRNWYYIQYYSLAYKRIAIIFFLLLAIYGLYSVFIKVKDQKSNFYLLRTNALALLFVLVVSAGFHWDRIIADYNFSRGKGAFVHLDFLAELSDSALPELDQPMDVLKNIDHYQEASFFKGNFSGAYRDIYLTPNEYKVSIEWRKQVFKRRWEKKSWLEWNYAEALAYEELEHSNAF